MDLLAAGHEGRVGGEAVAPLLAQAEAGAESPRAGGGGFDELYARALSEGLNPVLDRIADDLVARSLAENGGKKTKTLKDLRISTRLLYASLARRGGA